MGGGYTGGGAQAGARPMGSDSLGERSTMGGASMHPAAQRPGQPVGAGSRDDGRDPFAYPTPSAPRRPE
jgi:hypothetical protein